MRPLIVEKRLPGEHTDIREFVRPGDAMVQHLAASATWSVESLWAWVLGHIAYPPGPEAVEDRHVFFAYPTAPGSFARRAVVDDYWNFPAETLAQEMGDCEDSTGLLASLLIAVMPQLPVYVTVGYFFDYGHTWVSIHNGSEWLVLDTTLHHLPPAPLVAGRPYRPIVRFNNLSVLGPVRGLPATREAKYAKREAINAWYAGGNPPFQDSR